MFLMNIEITCKNSGSNLRDWTRYWDLKIFRIWDFTQLDENQQISTLLNFYSRLLAIDFMTDLQRAIFLNLLMNFSLIVGNLSLPAPAGKRTFYLKSRIPLPCQTWSSCTKNLESLRFKFLNSHVLFLTPNSNKN